MTKKLIFFAFFISFSLFFTACDPDEPMGGDPVEVITTVTYTLTPLSGGEPVVMTIRDLDGDGGEDPEVTEGVLMANTTYLGSFTLLNELETPVGDVSAEVLEEGLDHQFFFSQTVDGFTITYADIDVAGFPIGLATTLTTTVPESGNLNVILRHELTKNADGVREGNIMNAGGETDVEVNFPINVQ